MLHSLIFEVKYFSNYAFSQINKKLFPLFDEKSNFNLNNRSIMFIILEKVNFFSKSSCTLYSFCYKNIHFTKI